MNGRAVVYKPIVNEKSVMLMKQDLYTFLVDKSATKEQIAQVVAKKFSVDVLAVRTVSTSGKKKSYRTKRGSYFLSDSKKAIVKVKKGQKIAAFEAPVVEETQDVEVRTAEGEVIAKTKEKKSLLKGTKVKIEKGVEIGKETKQKEEPRKGAKQAGKTKGK